jgi:uncharacterized protein involved in exopolysaccharide biosynthesis
MSAEKFFDSAGSDEINIRQIIHKYTRYWKYFLLSPIVFITIGFIYLRYQEPEYFANARILVKDEKSGQSMLNQESIFKELGIFSGESNISNEIEMLKSRSLMISVVKSLNANIFYYSFGRPIFHERYKDSPISVTCVEKDNLKYENYQGRWEVKPINDSRFSLTDLASKKIIGEYKFGEEVNLNEGVLIFSKTTYFNNASLKKSFRIKILPVESAANLYLSNLTISPVNKTGSVVNISLKCSVPKKGIDIINQLIATHEMFALEDREKVSNNTARFIGERIKFISEELGNVESSVEQYKRNNKLTDITSEANLYLQSGSESEKKLIELGSELKLVDFMLSELKGYSSKDN